MSKLTDTHVISTLDGYDLLRRGQDPTPDRDLENWDVFAYDIASDIADATPNDGDLAPSSPEVRVYRPNWEQFRERITGSKREFLPPPVDIDAHAWYLPIHYYGPKWGIYVKEEAIELIAGYIFDRLAAPTGSVTEAQLLHQAAASTLYLHEAFHHKVESFAIRLEIARRAPVYIPYFENVYCATHGTNLQVEEIVATNEMYRRLQERTYRERLSADVYDATRKFLRQWIPTLPPSYRLGLSRGAGQRVNELCSQISEGAERPSQPPADWDVAPQMTRGLFSKDTVVYILVPRRPRP